LRARSLVIQLLFSRPAFLFAVRDIRPNFGEVIDAFKIEPNGALKLAAQTNISNFNNEYESTDHGGALIASRSEAQT
jgi:hypothetical protein